MYAYNQLAHVCLVFVFLLLARHTKKRSTIIQGGVCVCVYLDVTRLQIYGDPIIGLNWMCDKWKRQGARDVCYGSFRMHDPHRVQDQKCVIIHR
jgi:hypothetical protein